MSNHSKLRFPIDLCRDAEEIGRVLQLAVREALIMHKRIGNPIATWKNGKVVTYVELISLNAYKQLPQKTTITYPKTGTTFINYKTNNPSLFWAMPE